MQSNRLYMAGWPIIMLLPDVHSTDELNIMTTSKFLPAASLCGILSFSMVPAAHAGFSWIFQNTGSDCISGCTSSSGSNGNTASFYGHGVGAPNVTANAWSNTANNSTTPGNMDLQTSKLMTYSGGLGVFN